MTVNWSIDSKKRLSIEITEEVLSEKIGEKPLLKLRFQNKKEDRIFPLETLFLKREVMESLITAKASIMLPYVFFRDVKENNVVVQIELFYDGKRKNLGESFTLDSKYFYKEEENKEVPFWRWFLAFFLLPFALLFSFREKNKGRKLIVAANKNIKKWTGISFSIREFKISYFKKQYQKNLFITPNTILFLSERKVEEGGNLALILESLRKEKNLKVCTFLVEKTIDKLEFVELRTSAHLIAEAKLIILEDFYPQLHALDLRKETTVIQLWHACGAFKTFGFSRLFKPGGPEEESKNHRNYDKVFVSSEGVAPYYSEAFAISEKNVLSFGTPRTDVFFDEGYKEEVRKKLLCSFPFFFGKRIILFAPTFRGLGNKDAFYPKEKFSVKEFMKDLPKDVILIIKQHPFVNTEIEIPKEYEERVFDFSRKVPINDLLFVINLLITDYSSSVFEAALLNLPMLFYVFDEENYRMERDFYGDFDTFIPGVKASNMEELKKEVGNILSNNRSSSFDINRFKESYLSALDGKSTERITEYILNLIKEEKG